jgi:hypothetical protein
VIAQTPYSTNAIRVQDADGYVYEQTSVAPTTTYEYAINDKTISFHTDANANVINVSYFYSDAAAGKTVAISPTSVPSAVACLASVRAYDTDRKSWLTGSFVAELKKCTRNDQFPMGAANAEAAGFSFPFEAENGIANDVRFYFPGDDYQA